ncbi:MAG: branched-chain amino acid ABC transporter permease [Lentisphaeria bacterium]
MTFPVIILLFAKGLTVGGIYALISLGFNMIQRTTGILNFAQGEFVMVGGLGAAWLWHGLGLPLAAAMPGGALLAGLAGWLSYQAALRPAAGASVTIRIIITIGLAIVLRAVAALAWGTEPLHLPPLAEGGVTLPGGVVLDWQSVAVLAAVAAGMPALAWFFRCTAAGRAMQACAGNPDAARLCGISPDRVAAQAFAISAFLAGGAGVLLTPMLSMSFDGGTMLGLKGFAAAVLGGVGHPAAGVAGGLALGILEQHACWWSSVYKDTLALAAVLALLLIRPKGLLVR